MWENNAAEYICGTYGPEAVAKSLRALLEQVMARAA
jgi:hypothetical protein